MSSAEMIQIQIQYVLLHVIIKPLVGTMSTFADVSTQHH